MKILIASPYAIYPDVPHGGGQDLMALIRYLQPRHRIRIAAFTDSTGAAHMRTLQSLVETTHVIQPAFTPAAKANRALQSMLNGRLPRRAEAEMRAVFAEGWADVVIAAWTQMGRFLPAVPPGTVRILDEVDVRFIVDEYAGHPQLAQRKQAELAACRSADLVIVRSTRDRDVLHTYLPHLHIRVVPPVAHVADYLSVPTAGCVPGRVLFVGAMDRVRNQRAVCWLTQAVMPHLEGAHLRIVGANPPTSVRALSATVTGYVPDLRVEYQAASVVVAPMQSEAGVLNKILDGLAAGRPVVATPVANAGIGAPPEAVRLAADPADFAAHIQTLLTDPVAWHAQACAGRAFIRQHHTWSAAIRALEEALCELV
ncbi:MAG: glycosyltransferase [Chloroflexi bacterium]|nr:glycosyltransferase [Chloroflexota bacterium]